MKSSRGMRGTEEEANVSLICYLTNRLIYLKDISFIKWYKILLDKVSRCRHKNIVDIHNLLTTLSISFLCVMLGKELMKKKGNLIKPKVPNWKDNLITYYLSCC